MATQSTRYDEGSKEMDARLWGRLQDHIHLSMVYAKLPIGDFFRLRQVCKEWDRLASDRGFLLESFPHPLPQPYFIVGSRTVKHRLLYYEASARRWNWTQLPRGNIDVAGILCNYHQDSDRNFVFNVHTRMFHALGGVDLAGYEEYCYDPLIGMAVETSENPYLFKMILGDEKVNTNIYNSNIECWTNTPSFNEYWNVSQSNEIGLGESDYGPCSSFCDVSLYISHWRSDWVFLGFRLDVYNVVEDWWCQWFVSESEIEWDAPYDIGAWQDRLFVVGMKLEPNAIGVWELNRNPDWNWLLFDRMPEDLCVWMLAREKELGDLNLRNMREMQARFCGEYVLVYNCVDMKGVMERAVLYNLDRKTWEKVEVPGPRRHSSLELPLKAARAKRDSKFGVPPEISEE